MKRFLPFAVSVLITLGACARAPKRAAPSSPTAAPTAVQGEPDVRAAAFRALAELEPVTFAFDQADLSDAVRATLRTNANWLAEHPSVVVQVSGNCDQRGTAEYNLALGQKRAAAVRDYYLMLGVARSRVATISYGSERLLCSDKSADCYARNRRAETLEALAQTVGRTRTSP